jgi:DinB superfamily
MRRILVRSRPSSNEYPEYYDRYVNLVPDGDIEEILSKQRTETITLLSNVSEVSARKAYAPGKWTLKEVIGHMSDTERVMSYRMLAIARNESTPLQGMDQDVYVSAANFNKLSWAQLQADLATVRSATLSLISTIDDVAWIRNGTVWNSSVSTRVFAYIIAGHELHHLKVICDKYL